MATTSATADNPRFQNVSKKVRIIAAWMVDPQFRRQRGADALDVSYEYIRRTIRDLQSEEREMVANYELEAARGELLQAEVAQRLQEYNAISKDAPTNIKVSLATLQREIERLKTLEASASRGDEERAWVAGSAREFLESLIQQG